MYTSDIKRAVAIYGGITVFVFVFGIIYEYFSHNVTSYFMLYAFLIPLFGGAAAVTVHFVNRKKNSSLAVLVPQLLAGAVCWLTLGSIFKGVLEIYGTTNRLVWVFAVAGFIQLLAAVSVEIKTVKA